MRIPLLCVLALSVAGPAAQELAPASAPADLQATVIDGLRWREVGPYRGGRSCAVAGIPQDRDTYYFGACGGGVWKTTDGGRGWENVSDGFFGGSIGSVAVSEWDPNVVWVGTGEKTVRGNVSHGDGVWRSTDAGRTWSHVGLGDSRHVPRIRVHPRDPDTAWAAVLGHLFGPNDERGVFKTTDGGVTWKRTLFVSADAGAVDLCLDPTNARILYATTWNVRRLPWTLESGGPGSGLWKSTDGGETWSELTGNPGLPKGTLGIGGVSVSGADSDVVYAILEADDGGVFRSDDGGASWRQVNDDRELRQRAWYYTRIFADPVDADTVYVTNVGFWKSTDGGRDFERIGTPHGDNHDLWIDPNDPQRMIEANDGGVNVSVDGGAYWTPQDNQPTAQFYRVSVDDAFPYHLLGGQQDNSTVRIRSRNVDGGAITADDWSSTAGGESGHVVAQPGNPDLVFGGSYGGYLTWVDHGTSERRSVHVWPDSVMGYGADELRYRFQWNFPIFFSPHDPGVLYCAAQCLFRSEDLGQSWERISPDLTTNDKSKQGPSGGPITKDNTSVEYYCTIFAACESPHEKGVLWCGSDDGKLHVSRDAGASWQDVTPPSMPEWAQINSVDPHPTESGGLYVAATRYKLDDFRPYLFATTDYGATWREVVGEGIAEDHFTRALRADPEREGLLYAGTERGVYVSFDDGSRWRPLRSNLPIVPITDLAVKGEELVAATQGRGFWILNGLSVLRECDESLAAPHVFAVEPAWRVRMRGGARSGAGENPDGGVVFRYLLGELGDDAELSVTIRDPEGEVVRVLKPKGGKREPQATELPMLPTDAGYHAVSWDMEWPGARGFDGLVMWNRSLGGPTAVPGAYTADFAIGDVRTSVSFEILPDPRSRATLDDHRAQLAFLREIVTRLDRTHATLGELRDVRSALRELKARLGAVDGDGADAAKDLVARVDDVLARLKDSEETLYQTQSRSRQDPLNYPIRLNDKLGALNRASGGFGPTAAEQAVAAELSARIDAELAKIRAVIDEDVAAIQRAAREVPLPLVTPRK